MSKISELIKEKCPNGVKYELLKNICLFKRGQSITIKSLREGTYPVVAGGQKPAAYCSEFNRDYECITISSSGAYAGFVSYWNEKILCTDSFSITSKDKDILINKFIFYFLKSKQETIYSKKKGAGIPHVHISDIDALKIPIPPKEVQEEIVRILDKFCELETKLEEELEARKKQYEFWLDKTFNRNDVKFVELNSIGEITKLAGFEFSKYVNYSDNGTTIALRGLNVKNGHLILNDVKYLDNSDFSKLKRSKLYMNDILYTYVGTVGQVGLVDKNNKYYLAPNVARIRITKDEVNPKYIMYFLLSNIFKKNQLNTLLGNSSMKNITMANIRKFKIPIYSLSEQNKIVSILDKFDKLINDISKGIPAEIEARKKQYEYYRNKLLSFEELKDEKESI